MGNPGSITCRFACFAAVLLLCWTACGQSPAPAASSQKPSIATTTDTPENREFQKVEDSWSNAINMRDQYALELVLSPLFVDIAASGDVATRNQQVAQLINGEDKTIHLDQRVITVRMLGDVAVVNGTYTLHHKVGSAPTDEKGIFTHVFQRIRNGWLCVNSQRTILRETGPSTKTKKKASESEMPFHIPLFSKDKSNQ